MVLKKNSVENPQSSSGVPKEQLVETWALQGRLGRWPYEFRCVVSTSEQCHDHGSWRISIAKTRYQETSRTHTAEEQPLLRAFTKQRLVKADRRLSVEWAGRAIAQAVSRQLPTAAAWVQAQILPCEICGGQRGAGAGFLQLLRFPLPIFIKPIAPQSPSSIIWGWYNRPVVAAVPSGLSLTPRIVSKSAIVLQLLAVPSGVYKWLINPFTNTCPFYSLSLSLTLSLPHTHVTIPYLRSYYVSK
jgi:hypothetical protein